MKIQADITTWLLNEKPLACPDGALGNQDIFRLMRQAGMTMARVSCFSNDSPVVPLQSSLNLLKQLGQAGLDAFICLQCSDQWADPSHQQIPGAWQYSDSFSLLQAFKDYIDGVLTAIQHTGVAVRYIQIGNEISNGMLWPHFEASADYLKALKVAHAMCRHYFPDALIVLHTDLSYDYHKASAWYKTAALHHIDYDIAGLSYYPVWHGSLQALSDSIAAVSNISGKPVMLCEIGYMNTGIKTPAWFGDWTCDNIPYSPSGQKEYLERLWQFAGGNKALLWPDMFYWGMFSCRVPEHFPVSLFSFCGKPLPAYDAICALNSGTA